MKYVVILALVILSTGCKDEVTLMGVCWAGNQAIYVDDGKPADYCTTPEPLVWDKKPLLVKYNSYDEDYRDSFKEGVKYWNRKIPGLFEETNRFGIADVVVDYDGELEHPGLATHIRDSNGLMTAFVSIRVPVDSRKAYLRLAHELGHVVGLGHDPQKSQSIMNSYVGWSEGNWLDPKPKKIWYLSGDDKDALLETNPAWKE